MLLPIGLAACAGGDSWQSISYTGDRGVTDQPYPANYRTEILAFMRTYLNDPSSVRDAVMAEPIQRTVGGRQRYVTCLRYTSHEPDGTVDRAGDRAVVYVDGRLDRIIEKGSDLCAGAAYAPFPEMDQMKR